MKYKVLFSTIFLFVISQVVIAQQVPANLVPPKRNLLGPGDEITVKVLGEETYNFVGTVDEDGMLEAPFGDKPIIAKCRTEKEVREDLTKQLKRYLKEPQVGVTTKINSRPPTTVAGEVRVPGSFDLRRKVSLLEMLNWAGGSTDEAGGVVQVFRPQPPLCSDTVADSWKSASNDPNEIPMRTYSLSSLTLGQQESNPTIYPGDVIVVWKAKPVYVTGEVVAPQGVYIKERGLSLMTAIAMVNGLTHDAKSTDIRIYRQKPGAEKRDELTANYDLIKKGQQKDIMLEPYDLVAVGKAKDSIAVTMMKIAIGLGKNTVGGMSGAMGTRIIY